MKIIKLKSSNIKRIEAVCITPDPDNGLVTIGGLNGSGKSSCLDSILWGIAGGRELAEIPVRKGEERAAIELDLDDLKVRRTIAANGNMTLMVTNKEGLKYSSPQAILDALMGRLGFDPLEFSRQKPAEQYETLRALAGLDFSSLDQQRQEAYDKRTLIGREVKTLEGHLASLQQHQDVPADEVRTADIMQQWREATSKNEENQKQRTQLENLKRQEQKAKDTLDMRVEDVARTEKQIRDLETRLAQQKQTVELCRDEVARTQADVVKCQFEVEKLQDIPLDPFKDQIQNAETINRKVRQNQQRGKVVADLQVKRQAYSQLDLTIENLDAKKRKMISAAKFPIEGLSFEIGRVLFKGIPFSQLSSAEQLKISVAVGLALNPKLKVLLIRDGSLLDENSLKMISEMAAREEAQVWVELVRTDGDLSVIIEDGMVKGAPRPALEPEQPALIPSPEPAGPPPEPKKRGRRSQFVSDQSDLIP